MSAATSSPTPNPHATPPSPANDDAEFHQNVLRNLIQMGADIARQVHHKATTNPQADADPTQAFDRIARTVRRTILLARKLAEPPAVEPQHPRIKARKHILRAVEDCIDRKAEGPRAEALEAELRERLDSPELEDDINARPVFDIIIDILRDLGLSNDAAMHPWRRRTPEDIKILAARAAAPPRTPQRTPTPPPKPTPHLVPTPEPP